MHDHSIQTRSWHICGWALILGIFTSTFGEPKTGPEKQRRLFMSTDDGDAEIYTVGPDGKDRRQLTHNEHADNGPDWSSDGKHIAFLSNRDGAAHQVYMMDADGANVRQLTHEKMGVGAVKCGPGERLAYSALRKKELKYMEYDLILTDGKTPQTIARNLYITEFAWSPDGTFIAYSGIDHIVFHRVADGKQTVVRFGEIDERLRSHGADNITWQADGASLTCMIRFLGGRKVGHKMFGDTEIFTITTAGKVNWIKPASSH